MSKFLILPLCLFLLSCQDKISASGLANQTETPPVTDQKPPAKEIAPPGFEDIKEGDIDSVLVICSLLDFKDVTLPAEMSTIEINLFALGLNITGSFEGNDGWQNLANNFDDQGMSLGLLQQNLGQKSLQPLLLGYQQMDDASFQSHFSLENYNQIMAMLSAWQDNSKRESFQLFAEADKQISFLDIGVSPFVDRESVRWAEETIYEPNSGVFKEDWRKSFLELAIAPLYRNQQLMAAIRIHNRALSYMDRFGLSEIRSYLFLFDIVVQNGGFFRSNRNAYDDFLSSNPNATERQKLEFLLENRLQNVRRQFREIVRERKQALIDGFGIVQRSDRNFEQEHCYTGEIPTDELPIP